MTKVMKLNVSYDGYYGGSVDETVILPMDINGVLFEELEEKTYSEAISLGEIAGKHSDEYGDLTVDFIDLDELSIKQVTDLINESYYGEFEVYFEGAEESLFEDSDEEDDKTIEDKIDEIFKKYNVVRPRWGTTNTIYGKFIEQLKDKYVKSFSDITVLEEDYDKASKLLKDNNIKTYE